MSVPRARITNDELFGAFQKLCRALGKEYSAFPSQKEGVWWIDDSPQYGGVAILEARGKGEDRPFGLYSRVPRRQFVEQIEFALRSIEMFKRSAEVR